MQNYCVLNNYVIYEIPTNTVIHIDTNKKNIKKLVNNLNTRKSGFSGNTPPFFSNNYKNNKYNIT
jgi:hypothetical protein